MTPRGCGPVGEPAIRGQAVAAIRVVSTADALDRASWPADATVLRTASDEALLVDVLDTDPPEPHAIVFPDTGWVRFVLTPAEGQVVMARSASWPPPTAGLGQGMVAGIPAKVVVGDPWWLLVPAALAEEFGARIREVLT